FLYKNYNHPRYTYWGGGGSDNIFSNHLVAATMLDNYIISLIRAIVFFVTLIRSVCGFGEALIAVPLLALFLPVKVAAPVAVLISITVALVVSIQDWHHIHFNSAKRLVVSTFIGTPVGLLLLI